ncbi:MAG: DUF6184 family natural product biosynthesis lipoprotein [Cystobacter sp.]
MNAWITVAGVVGLIGCGGSTVPGITQRQADAVNSAAISTCDRYEECEGFGTDKKYPTRDACISKEKDNWNGRWSVTDCDNRINKDKLQVCLDALESTSCQNILDQANTVFAKCPQSDVCSGS